MDIYMVYLPTHLDDFFMVNVGKYASPMDPLGISGFTLIPKTTQ